MSAPSTPVRPSGRPVPPPARKHPMATRSVSLANAAYQTQLANRRAQYENCADTGFVPPEYGHAPVKPGTRSRLFA